MLLLDDNAAVADVDVVWFPFLRLMDGDDKALLSLSLDSWTGLLFVTRGKRRMKTSAFCMCMIYSENARDCSCAMHNVDKIGEKFSRIRVNIYPRLTQPKRKYDTNNETQRLREGQQIKSERSTKITSFGLPFLSRYFTPVHLSYQGTYLISSPSL